jgi:hypothetical protein
MRSSRYQFPLIPVKSVLLTIALAATGLVRAVDTKADVVLILSDDQGSIGYGVAGYPVVPTRSLDRPKSQNLFCARGIVMPFYSSGESRMETAVAESDAGKPAHSSLCLT